MPVQFTASGCKVAGDARAAACATKCGPPRDVFAAFLGRDCLRVAAGVGFAERVEPDQANTSGVERGLGTTLDPQLAQDTAHVGLDRLFGDSQIASDLLVGGAAC